MNAESQWKIVPLIPLSDLIDLTVGYLILLLKIQQHQLFQEKYGNSACPKDKNMPTWLYLSIYITYCLKM